jgi:Brp/Blh family beta-carotene 15,15'-monooxygenase
VSVAVEADRGRRRLATAVLVPGWVVLAALLPLGAAGLAADLPVPVRYVPLVVSVVVLGIPHGAVDHLTLPRARGEPVGRRSTTAVVSLYLLLGGAYAVAWGVAPVASFVFFLALTWFHWGQGDVYPLVAYFERSHLDDLPGRALAATVRGGLPMVVPLVGSPDRYREVAARVVGLVDPGSGASLAWLVRPDLRVALGGGLALLSVIALWRGYRRRGGGRSWRVDATETTLLWAYFLVVPPVLAVGLYFPLWHGLRHVGRLVELDAGGRGGFVTGGVRTAFARFAREAAPLSVASVVLLGAVAATVPAGVGSVPDVAAVYLVLLSVLTLPHAVVVTRLDLVQGVW